MPKARLPVEEPLDQYTGNLATSEEGHTIERDWLITTASPSCLDVAPTSLLRLYHLGDARGHCLDSRRQISSRDVLHAHRVFAGNEADALRDESSDFLLRGRAFLHESEARAIRYHLDLG